MPTMVVKELLSVTGRFLPYVTEGSGVETDKWNSIRASLPYPPKVTYGLEILFWGVNTHLRNPPFALVSQNNRFPSPKFSLYP